MPSLELVNSKLIINLVKFYYFGVYLEFMMPKDVDFGAVVISIETSKAFRYLMFQIFVPCTLD